MSLELSPQFMVVLYRIVLKLSDGSSLGLGIKKLQWLTFLLFVCGLYIVFEKGHFASGLSSVLWGSNSFRLSLECVLWTNVMIRANRIPRIRKKNERVLIQFISVACQSQNSGAAHTYSRYWRIFTDTVESISMQTSILIVKYEEERARIQTLDPLFRVQQPFTIILVLMQPNLV